MPTGEGDHATADSPVRTIGDEQDARGPQDGLALCLSGGGYRAMLFHLGAIWRLNDIGLLGKLDRVSSVSGGSITAAVLGLRWSALGFGSGGVARNLQTEVIAPVRSLADRTIDAGAVLGGVLLPGSVSDKVVAAYRKHLYGDATLQDLPDRPRFILNATNVQSGALFRFSKPYAADYRVGTVKNPRIALATAVAASSAFPPVLSPLELELEPGEMRPLEGADLHAEPYTTQVVLTDGGVYDNLGLETAWKRYKTVLVSDGGGQTAPEADPKRDWGRHAFRVLNLIDNQVRSLRKRQIIEAFKDTAEPHDGTYWGIRTRIADYGVADALPCPADRTQVLAETPTRLKRLEPQHQERLINWGYAVCDAAVRRHVSPGTPAPTAFPYPASAV
jgi:NTE family protein